MAKYFLFNEAGAFIGSADTVPLGTSYTDVDPKAVVNPTWDGKGWVAGVVAGAYAGFKDYGFASELAFATSEASETIAGVRATIQRGFGTQLIVDAVDQLIAVAKGGAADDKKLDAFVAVQADRVAGLATLDKLDGDLAKKPKLAAVLTIMESAVSLPVLGKL